jgi:hypothetical protein
MELVSDLGPSAHQNVLGMAAEAIQTKPAAPVEGAATMSQVAAQSAIKKTDGDDSLSPFTSDAEDAKPRKSATALSHFSPLTLCFFHRDCSHQARNHRLNCQ